MFVCRRQSHVSLWWWWHFKWRCAWEMLFEEDQSERVPFRAPMWLHCSEVSLSPHPSCYLCALIIQSIQCISHPLASCFCPWALSSTCPMIALFISTTATTFLVFSAHVDPLPPKNPLPKAPSLPPVSPCHSLLCWVKQGHIKALRPKCEAVHVCMRKHGSSCFS